MQLIEIESPNIRNKHNINIKIKKTNIISICKYKIVNLQKNTRLNQIVRYLISWYDYVKLI